MKIFLSILLVLLVSILLPLYGYFAQYHSEHFIIYHSREINHRWIEKCIRILEKAQEQLSKRFLYVPERVLSVIIYQHTWEFTQATHQPSYVGGLYNGRLYIQPPRTLQRFRRLRTTLFHEYTHFMVDEIAGSNIPQWFNEGLALYVAGEEPIYHKRAKINSFNEVNKLIKQKVVKQKVNNAYFIALKGVKYLIKKYSWLKVVLFLKQLNDEPFKSHFTKFFHTSFQAFEQKLFQQFR